MYRKFLEKFGEYQRTFWEVVENFLGSTGNFLKTFWEVLGSSEILLGYEMFWETFCEVLGNVLVNPGKRFGRYWGTS